MSMLRNLAMQLLEGNGSWDTFPWGEGTATMPLEGARERLHVKGGQHN